MAGEPGLFGDPDAAEGPESDAPSPFSGPLADAMRAKIGRPAGSRNKRDQAAEAWYFAKGYVDPLQRLGELVSEDPRVLQAWFADHSGVDAEGNKRPAPTILEVVRMQIAAAGELMPYLHGKKPIDVNVLHELLPTLIIRGDFNQVDQARAIEAAKALSIGSPIVDGDANEIKDLEGGE